MSGDAHIAAAGVSPGDVLAGKYRVEQVLGVGGMGVVVAAEHLQLRERVALKFLHPEVVRDEDAVRRFLREAQSAVRIKSEHVARVTDVGTLENGAPYMVMEYLTGTDLSGYVETRGPLPLGEATEFMLQACDALAEAHALGIVHRDLKPANLFLTRRADGSPLVKVLDFGISKNVTPIGESKALTQTSSFVGSPYYMSPEQLRSAKAVDARSDVWSLGVVLYELLTAAHPFEADTLTGLMIAISTEAPISLSVKRPDIDPRIQDLLSRCLERDLLKRVQNVAEFASLLSPFASPHARHYVDRITRILGASAPPPTMQPVMKTVALEGSQGGPPGLTNANASASANLAVNTAGGWAETNKEPIVVPVKTSKVPLVLFATLVTLGVAGGVVWMVRPAGENASTPPVSASAPLPATASATPPTASALPVAEKPSAPPAAEASAVPANPPKKLPVASPAASAAPAAAVSSSKRPATAPPPAMIPPSSPPPKKPTSGSAFDTQ